LNILFHGRLEPARDGQYLLLDLQNLTNRTVVVLFRFHSSLCDNPLDDSGAGRMMAGLFPGVRVRMFLDLGLMEDGRSFHQRMPGVGILYNSGPLKRLPSIKAVSVMVDGLRESLPVKIRKILPVKTAPQPALLEPRRPLVDGLGQWAGGTWPGKSAGLGGEIRAPEPLQLPEAVRIRRKRQAGFIKLQNIGGKSWLVSPESGPFFSSGMDVVRFQSGGPTRGFEGLFPPLKGLDITPRGEVSFYTENLKKRYGPEGWREKWANLAVDRLAGWGFNTIGNWSDELAISRRRLPYTLNAAWWDAREDEGVFAGFPDVFSTGFEAHCDRAARRGVRPDDSLLIGYFLHNEPQWGHGRVNLAERAWKSATAPATRSHLVRWLGKRGRRTPDAKSLDAFQELMLERYFSVVCSAVRRHDPNHLLLGVRFAAVPPACLIRPMRHMDVVTLNNYEPVPNPRLMADLHRLTGKPLLIGEFHFGAVDRGMNFFGLQGVASQRDRGKAFARYMEAAAAIPYCLGAHWFQYMDQPVLGRYDGENYNIGFVDVCDRPYPELVAEARETNRRLPLVHAGKLAPRKLSPRYVPTGVVW
jgi:hypothetical protein